jgi:large subunit ribosomal protein L34e
MAVPARKRKSTTRVRATPKGHPTYKLKSHKQAKARCAICGNLLGGVPNLAHSGMAKLAKTEKRPERMYGGILCHSCLAGIIKDKMRLQQGLLSKEDVDFRRLKYLSRSKTALK